MAEFSKRSEVEEKLCWDLSALYQSDAEAEAAFQEAKAQAQRLHENYVERLGEMDEPRELLAFLEEYQRYLNLQSRLYHYYYLHYVVDMNDSKWRSEMQRFGLEMEKMHNLLAFVQNDLIAEVKPELYEKLLEIAPEYGGFVRQLSQQRAHRLSPETEAALTALYPSLSSPGDLYEVVKFNDLKFPNFELEGKDYPLSYVLYENVYAYSPETALRRESFRRFSEELRRYQETTAAIYNNEVQTQNRLAKLRKYDSVFDYLLAGQEVSRELYDRQIDILMDKLRAPMRRYAELLKEVHGLDKLYFSDLKLPLDPEFSEKISYEEARDLCADVLALAGDDYRDFLMPAFHERWLDFAQNEGKSTGGFATSIEGVHPYVLLNWDNSMAEVFTLVHELGHAGQDILSAENNPTLCSGMSMYTVEAPSTFHELLLGYHLMHQEDSTPRFKRWVASLLIGNTYYHNMVTHLHEAAYQREVYRRVEAGESLDATTLSEIFKGVLSDFWGETVVLDPGAELTWMRQPHYYMGLYSYTYSAGLTIATEMFQRLLAEGPSVLEKWRRFLSAGEQYIPIEQAALAEIDIRDEAALLRTVDYVSSLVDDCVRLTAEMQADAR